jgi:XTP/dITP diphosphohydrolase
MELVIATANPQKVLILREILKELLPRVAVCSLFDFPDYKLPEQEELAESAIKNDTIALRSKQKAEHAAKALNRCCLSEEWRLVTPSLSFSLAGCDTNSAKTKKILLAIADKSEMERSAYLESTVTLAMPTGQIKQATGRIEGTLSEQERGKGGSDFDTIFIKHDYNKTVAELSPSVKMRVSQRRKAVEKILMYLEKCITS